MNYTSPLTTLRFLLLWNPIRFFQKIEYVSLRFPAKKSLLPASTNFLSSYPFEGRSIDRFFDLVFISYESYTFSSNEMTCIYNILCLISNININISSIFFISLFHDEIVENSMNFCILNNVYVYLYLC